VRRAVRFTLVVEFFVTLYIFPLAAELFLVPFLTLFVVLQAVTANDASLSPARGVIDAVLMLFGFGLIIYVTVSAITDLDGLLTRQHGEQLLVAPALTLAFVPFFYAVAWVCRRELDNLRRRWEEQHAAL
jgi:hypothetical protein